MDDPYAPPVTRVEEQMPRRKGWVGEPVLRSVGVVFVIYLLIEPLADVGMAGLREQVWNDDFWFMLGAAIAGVYGFTKGGRRWQLGIAGFMVFWIAEQVYGAMQQVERESWPDFPGAPSFPGWLSFAGSLVAEVIVLGCAVGLWWGLRGRCSGLIGAGVGAVGVGECFPEDDEDVADEGGDGDGVGVCAGGGVGVGVGVGVGGGCEGGDAWRDLDDDA